MILWTGYIAMTNLLCVDCILKKKLTGTESGKLSKIIGKDLNYYASNFVLNLPLDKDKIEPNKQGLIEVRHSGTGFYDDQRGSI